MLATWTRLAADQNLISRQLERRFYLYERRGIAKNRRFGIYLVSFAVTQWTQEIGLSMVLGASRSGFLGLMIAEGMKSVIACVLLGIAASFAMTRLMTVFLFGVPPTDWVTFSIAPVVLCVVALAANLARARRAASVDPMVALRYE
jgi:ABC-type antimicrobial peptide transport system permease subunit